VYKNTPRTIEQLKDAIRQEIQTVNVDTLGKVFQNLKKRIQVCLDVKWRPVSASIVGRSCFASFPVCVYKFSSHYLNNIIFIDNSLGPLARDSLRINNQLDAKITNFIDNYDHLNMFRAII